MKKKFLYIIFILFCINLSACNGSKYEDATELFKNGNYDEALQIFTELKTYKDSSIMARNINDIIKFSKNCMDGSPLNSNNYFFRINFPENTKLYRSDITIKEFRENIEKIEKEYKWLMRSWRGQETKPAGYYRGMRVVNAWKISIYDFSLKTIDFKKFYFEPSGYVAIPRDDPEAKWENEFTHERRFGENDKIIIDFDKPEQILDMRNNYIKNYGYSGYKIVLNNEKKTIHARLGSVDIDLY